MADEIRVYHNPNCGTSRKVLALLREKGIQPVVVEYLKNPPTKQELAVLVQKSGLPVREFLRTKEKLFADLQLGEGKWSEEELLEQLAGNPALLNRPVVASRKGVRPCRPAETVLELL